MKNKINFLILFLFLLSFSYEENEGPIGFEFKKTIYIKPTPGTKLIPVKTSRTNNICRLYINGTQCIANEEEKSMFYCPVQELGVYNFSYIFNKTEYQILQNISIFSSMEDIFIITPSRETKCLFDDETLSYTLEVLNENISVNFSNIQIFAYAPENKHNKVKVNKKIETIVFDVEIIDDYKAIFTLNSTHLNKQYIVRVTENFDYDDTLGKIQSFTFTELTFDEYFYPFSKTIRIKSNLCEFKPDKLTLIGSGMEYPIICNESSKFYYSNFYYCYFNEEIDFYGKMNIYFHNQLIKKDIISSKPIEEISINTRYEEHIEKINCDRFNRNCDIIRYIRFIISSANDYFHIGAINRLYVEHGDYFETSTKIYERNVRYSNYGKLNYDGNTIFFDYLNTKGEFFKVLKLERTLFENEKIHKVQHLTYIIPNPSNVYCDKLDNIYFNPDLIVMGNLDTNNYQSTKLYFVSSDARYKYGYKFCGSSIYTTPVKFNCFSQYYDNSNYHSVKLLSSEPGFIKTRLRYYTEEATIKVINVEIENHCQNIYGQFKNLDNAIINIYYPKENKNIKIIYNGTELIKNDKIDIEKNPMDYNFESYVIPPDKIVQEGMAIFYYNNQEIGKKKITYTNTIIPTIIKSKEIINTKEYVIGTQIKIRFKEQMTIGTQETYFYLQYYENRTTKYENCYLQNDGIILLCNNNNFINKILYYQTTCEGYVQLDYQVIFYTPSETNYELSKYYYVLPGYRQSITLYLDYTSPYLEFPAQAYVNNQRVKMIETQNIHRLYKFKTNEEGDYKFEFLLPDSNDRQDAGLIKVRNSIYDYFSEIGFEKKCVYYTDTTNFKLIPTHEIDMNKILYYSDYGYNNVCQSNNCVLEVKNSNNYYNYNYRDNTFIIISKNGYST